MMKDKNACGLKLKYFCIFAAFLNTTMSGKDICKYLKSVRREVAAANGLELDISECGYEGECPGTCPRCENEVRQLEQALSMRKSLSQKVSVLGVAAGLALSGMTAASAQTVVPVDTSRSSESTFEEMIEGELPELEWHETLHTAAMFAGGVDSLSKYIMDNFHPNFGEMEFKNVRVLVEFCVEKTGTISEVKIVEGVHPRVDEEVVRMISNMPPWKPATEWGRPVRSYYTLPISFDF